MRLRRFGLLALPILGIAELGLHLGFAARPPPFEAYASVEPVVRSMKRPGELVVMAPPWADPLLRQALGEDLLGIADAARPDATRYESALEVSILGERSEELAGWRDEDRRDVGRFVVRRRVNPSPAHVVYDFVDHLAPPTVDVRVVASPGQAADCPWNPAARVVSGGLGGHPTFPARRFECAGSIFYNVGVTVIAAGERFEPRRCIWAHPAPRGELAVRFHDVPLGRVVHGHHGMYWIIEREGTGAPVTLTVRVDGDAVGEVVHRDGDGWSSFDLDLGAHAGAASAEVEFAVTSPNNLHRHYCFEADTR